METVHPVLETRRLFFLRKILLLALVSSIPFYIFSFLYQRTTFYLFLPFVPLLTLLYRKTETLPAGSLYRAFSGTVTFMVLILLATQKDIFIFNIFLLLLPPTYILLLGKSSGLKWSILIIPLFSAVNIATHPIVFHLDRIAENATFFITIVFAYLTITIISFQIDSMFEFLIESLVVTNNRLEERNAQLVQTREELQFFKTTLPVCSSCKRIRDESGVFVDPDIYIREHSDTAITHSLCPDCLAELYPDIAEKYRSEPGRPGNG